MFHEFTVLSNLSPCLFWGSSCYKLEMKKKESWMKRKITLTERNEINGPFRRMNWNTLIEHSNNVHSSEESDMRVKERGKRRICRLFWCTTLWLISVSDTFYYMGVVYRINWSLKGRINAFESGKRFHIPMLEIDIATWTHLLWIIDLKTISWNQQIVKLIEN